MRIPEKRTKKRKEGAVIMINEVSAGIFCLCVLAYAVYINAKHYSDR